MRFHVEMCHTVYINVLLCVMLLYYVPEMILFSIQGLFQVVYVIKSSHPLENRSTGLLKSKHNMVSEVGSTINVI